MTLPDRIFDKGSEFDKLYGEGITIGWNHGKPLVTASETEGSTHVVVDNSNFIPKSNVEYKKMEHIPNLVPT